MAALDWDAMSEQYGSKYKDYAPAGIWKAKVDSVENRKSSTGTIWQEFKFQDSEKYAFPKVSHPLSEKNANWRAWHWKELFMLMGATEENAKKAVESCEGKANFTQIQAAYCSAMERLVNKHPEIEIETWKDGKYMRADFNDHVRLNHPDDEPYQSSNDNPLEGAEEATDIDSESIPF